MISNALILEKPKEYTVNQVDYDGLWKKVIGDLFEEFCFFYAIALIKEIDFMKSPEFLQQERFKEIIKEKKGRKIAD